MTVALVLYSQRNRDQVVEPDAKSVLRIEGERAWAIRGQPSLIELAKEDLAGIASRVHEEVLHLDFGNSVGVFRVRNLGTIEVTSGKWEEHHFDSMLADIARIGSALPFSAGTAGPLPYDRTLSAREDLLYHAYVYIRHILSDSAPAHARLLPALRAILAEPHRRAHREITHVPTEQIQHIDANTIMAIVNAKSAPMPGTIPGLPKVLEGRLPAILPENHFRTTVDTPENRFAKAFLGSIVGVLDRMRRVCANGKIFSTRVRAECGALEDRLRPFVRHPLWRAVGTMTQVPLSSTVLQRRTGYRELLRHFILLRLATRHLPISQHEARDLLEGKDIAALYEMWCYFRVVDVVSELLGAPTEARMISQDDLQSKIGREVEVVWPNNVRALYNATFSLNKPVGRESYSLPLRPDVVIVLPDGTIHILDAKFRLEWIDGADHDDDARVKLDDVYKMHTYRDAIGAARSAWVLYPGTETRAYAPAGTSAPVDGVGAAPLRPEPDGGDALKEHLAAILANHALS